MLHSQQTSDWTQCEGIRIFQLVVFRVTASTLQSVVCCAHQPRHAKAINEPTDAEEASTEQVGKAPGVALQVKVMKP